MGDEQCFLPWRRSSTYVTLGLPLCLLTYSSLFVHSINIFWKPYLWQVIFLSIGNIAVNKLLQKKICRKKTPALMEPLFKWMIYFLHVLILLSILMTFFCPSPESGSGHCRLVTTSQTPGLHWKRRARNDFIWLVRLEGDAWGPAPVSSAGHTCFRAPPCL